MVISGLKGKNIFLDTAPLIYFIEGQSEFQECLKELFALIDNDEILAITPAGRNVPKGISSKQIKGIS